MTVTGSVAPIPGSTGLLGGIVLVGSVAYLLAAATIPREVGKQVALTGVVVLVATLAVDTAPSLIQAVEYGSLIAVFGIPLAGCGGLIYMLIETGYDHP